MSTPRLRSSRSMAHFTFSFYVGVRSLETECRRSTELQDLLNAAERTARELPATYRQDTSSITELKNQLDEQQRKTSQLQGLLDDEARQLSADKVKRRHK